MVVWAHEWHAKRVVAVRKSTQQANSTRRPIPRSRPIPWRRQAKSAPQVTVSCRRSPAKSAGPTTSPFDAFTRSAALPHPTQAMPWSVTTTVAAVTTMQGCQGNDVWSETQTNWSHNSHGWTDASSWWSEGEQHEHTAQTEQTPAQSPWHLESVRLRAAFAESIARAQTEQTALESMPHPQTEHTALESMPHAQTEPGFSGGGSQETALESMASAQTEQTELESMAPRISNAAQQLEAVRRLLMRDGAHQVQEQEQVQDQVHSGSGPGAGGDGDSKEQVPNGDIIFLFYKSNQAWSGSCGEIGAVLSWATGKNTPPKRKVLCMSCAEYKAAEGNISIYGPEDYSEVADQETMDLHRKIIEQQHCVIDMLEQQQLQRKANQAAAGAAMSKAGPSKLQTSLDKPGMAVKLLRPATFMNDPD